MGIVAARIDADAAAIGLTLPAGRATFGANTIAANSAGTGCLTAAAVFGIGGEVTTAVDSAAILHTDGAVRPLADAAAALDSDQTALADLAAGPAVVQIGLKIDAGAAAVD
jgi:hypothetical protein